MKSLLILFFTLVVTSSFAQREVYDINRNWEYVPGWEVQKDKSTTINLPHTWNLDALSGKWDYHRGLSNYVKMVEIPSSWSDKRVYLRCKGVNETADVYINSKHIGQHKGGYTAFAYDITPYISTGSKNSIWIRVTNSLDLDVMPLLGDFNFYGGIYRDVELIVTPNVHLDVDYYASSGIKIRTFEVSDERARIDVTARVTTSIPTQALVKFKLYSQSDSLIEESVETVKVNEQGSIDVRNSFLISNPHLWDGVKDPYLYRVSVTVGEVSSVKSKKKVVIDSLSTNVGLRYFSVDKNNQFLLNGKPYLVKGVGRHQDWAMQGNALFKQNHQKDIEWMLDMGANAVRLAHYPQDPYFIDLCDKAGLLVWSEIPFVGPGGYRDKGFNDSQAFMDNGQQQLLEMINQLGNHPSIIWWGLFNEINQRGDDPVAYVEQLNKIVKEEDPTRLTVAASNQDGRLNFITDLIGFNQYFGWYSGEPSDLKVWANRLRKEWPNLKVSLAEYGAGGSIYQHSDSLVKTVPTSYWHPEQWQTYCHEAQWKVIKEGYFWGTFVWCMFDFGAAHRTEGLRPGINDKGLVTFDRAVGKDAFYFYKANWNEHHKFVYIAERRWQERPQLIQTLKVFSNCPDVELFVNGVSQGLKSNDGYGTFVWKGVKMKPGENVVEAYSNSAQFADSCKIIIEHKKSL